LKFENQHAHLVALPYRSSRTVMLKERWSVQHHIAAVELFIKTGSVTAIQHGLTTVSQM
jgi:hypothetical protein